MAARKPAIDKPTGVWDDIVYPIARRVTKGLVKSKVIKNTTRVKVDRKVLDRGFAEHRAFQAQRARGVSKGKAKAAAREEIQMSRAKVRDANRIERGARGAEFVRSQAKYSSTKMSSQKDAVKKGASVRSSKTGIKGKETVFGTQYGTSPRAGYQARIANRQSPAAKARKARERKENMIVGAGTAGILGASTAASYGAMKGIDKRLFSATKPKKVKTKSKGRGGSTKKR